MTPALQGLHPSAWCARRPLQLASLGPCVPPGSPRPVGEETPVHAGHGVCSAHAWPCPGVWGSPLPGAGVTMTACTQLPCCPLFCCSEVRVGPAVATGCRRAGVASVSFLSRPPVSRAVPCAASGQAWPSLFTACGLWRGPSGGVGSRSAWEVWPAASRLTHSRPRPQGAALRIPSSQTAVGAAGGGPEPSQGSWKIWLEVTST